MAVFSPGRVLISTMLVAYCAIIALSGCQRKVGKTALFAPVRPIANNPQAVPPVMPHPAYTPPPTYTPPPAPIPPPNTNSSAVVIAYPVNRPSRYEPDIPPKASVSAPIAHKPVLPPQAPISAPSAHVPVVTRTHPVIRSVNPPAPPPATPPAPPPSQEHHGNSMHSLSQ